MTNRSRIPAKFVIRDPETLLFQTDCKPDKGWQWIVEPRDAALTFSSIDEATDHIRRCQGQMGFPIGEYEIMAVRPGGIQHRCMVGAENPIDWQLESDQGLRV